MLSNENEQGLKIVSNYKSSFKLLLSKISYKSVQPLSCESHKSQELVLAFGCYVCYAPYGGPNSGLRSRSMFLQLKQRAIQNVKISSRFHMRLGPLVQIYADV